MRNIVSLVLLCLCATWPTTAQILQGEWVDESQAAIEKHRKTDVTIIVLDQQDRAVQGATVRLIQQRHDFLIGLTLPTVRMPPERAGELPVYRCFNAIAMDRYTDWANPLQSTPQVQAKRLAAWAEAINPLQTQYGRVISADPAKNQDRLSLLDPADLRDVVLARIEVAATHELQHDHFDVYADLLGQEMIERKLGQGMLPRMFDRAEAHQPGASFGVRVRDAISLQFGPELASAVQKLEIRQVPVDHVTIEQRFSGPIQPNALRRMLDKFIDALPAPVTFAKVEVGGPTPVAAAIKMETLLRLMFAQPNIAGITFGGLYEEELQEKNAALLNAHGKATASGEVIDAFFNKLWHSDVSAKTDERGNIEARVFTGWYSLTAELPDGTQIESRAYIPKTERLKRIVLQMTAAEAK